MGRNAAVVWHASSIAIAAVLYFLFTLPRWWELTGFTPHALGTVLRIVTGLLIAQSALPALFTLRRARRPEFGTPQLALTLLVASIVAQAGAGVLIVGAAASEIWLSLDDAGTWLFGIYGAAAALALLGVAAFYLSFVAELPPPPPKPLKPKKEKAPRRRRRASAESAEGAESAGEADEDQTVEDEADEAADEAVEAAADEATESAEPVAALRPSGKRTKNN